MNDMTKAILQQLDAEGVATMRGAQAVAAARDALEYVLRTAGGTIAFDPTSAPDLVDLLTVTALSGLEGAALGAAVGGLLGLVVGKPRSGVALGAGLGAVAGVARGVNRVGRGWRVCAVWEASGEALVTIHALGAS